MNLTPINVYITTNSNKNTVKQFSLFLLDILSSIKLIQWHCDNYNLHKILDKVYQNFEIFFDKLSEEIIGITVNKNVSFNIEPPKRNLNKIIECESTENQIEEYFYIIESLCSTLKSKNMEIFCDSSFNGIKNTIEEILSESNKSVYLIKMLK